MSDVRRLGQVTVHDTTAAHCAATKLRKALEDLVVATCAARVAGIHCKAVLTFAETRGGCTLYSVQDIVRAEVEIHWTVEL